LDLPKEAYVLHRLKFLIFKNFKKIGGVFIYFGIKKLSRFNGLIDLNGLFYKVYFKNMIPKIKIKPYVFINYYDRINGILIPNNKD
jgi:hypothetical protein